MFYIASIILYTFLMYGLSNILIYGSIFQWFRNILFNFGSGDYSLYKLFTCMMCLPTWLGFVFAYLMYYIDREQLLPLNLIFLLNDYKYLSIFFNGLLTSGLVYFVNTFVEFLESKQN